MQRRVQVNDNRDPESQGKAEWTAPVVDATALEEASGGSSAHTPNAANPVLNELDFNM